MDYGWSPFRIIPRPLQPYPMFGAHEIFVDACFSGHLRILCSILNALPAESRESYVEYEMTMLNGERRTPLISATLGGQTDVVQVLIEQFHADMEHAGAVVFDDVLVKGVTPLWVAAGTGRFGIVKTLVRSGANVNAFTVLRSTPIRAACYDGRIDIIDYLVSHGADPHVTNIFSNNCLMLAAYRGKLEAVIYFLEKGLDINGVARCGNSALFLACQSGHVNVVRYLIARGAKLLPNNEGKSPLKIAAEYTRELTVLFFLHDDHSLFVASKEDIVNAYELLAASFGTDRDNYNLEKAFMYLEKAMRLRFSLPTLMYKPSLPTIPAYSNWVESRSPGELALRQYDRDALHMECLTIRERILGSNSLSVANGAIYRGAVYADQTRFDRCIELWLHALRIRVRLQASVSRDVKRFVELFYRLLYATANWERDIHLATVKEVLEAAIFEMKALMRNSRGNASEIDNHCSSCFMLLIQITRIIREKAPDVLIYQIKKEVYNLIKIDPRTSSGRSLLHLAASNEHDMFSSVVWLVRCPNVDLVALLLECGADVNGVDARKNTPLHLLVSFPRPVQHLLKLISIVNMMVSRGAHVDAMNARGQTPMTTVDEGMAETLFGRLAVLSLRCLAATAAASQFTECPCGWIPETLVPFTELHSPRMFRHNHSELCGFSSRKAIPSTAPNK